jgi:deoxynucleoside triphosphate triphosphohydrolase SAMHD1
MYSQQIIEDDESPAFLDSGESSEGIDWSATKWKVVHDPIHKSMMLPDPVIKIVDTPQFQRLRDLKQLGTVYFIYPGASHNRFEHSLGVSYVSGKMIDYLAQMHPERCITQEERIWVRIAGAVHDLGHGK